jgi:hypothetical protein
VPISDANLAKIQKMVEKLPKSILEKKGEKTKEKEDKVLKSDEI